jgi:hypothetical protein
VGVTLGEDGVTIANWGRTIHLAWDDIARAELVPIRSGSPLDSERYRCLELVLVGDRVRRYDTISMPPDESGGVSDLVDQINRFLGGRASPA